MKVHKKLLALLLAAAAAAGQPPIAARAETTQALAAVYNADVTNLTGITPVENQSDTGYCWAYMADAVLESYLLRQRQTTNDFSEQHMFRQLSYDTANPGCGFANLASSASYHQAIGYWVRGVKYGPVQEGDSSETPLDAYISDTIELGSYMAEDAQQKADYIQEIKRLVTNYGAVGVSVWFSPDTQTLTTRNGAYYYNDGASRVNHGVTVVGWDDTYGVENFYNQLSTPHQPAAPGAFLVKNSWGLDENSVGGTGYYWISYENYFQDAFAVRAVTSRTQLYDHLYETDYRGLSEYVLGSSYSNSYTFAGTQQVTALATYVKAGASYQFSINGTPVQTMENTTVEDSGYRIFHLTSPLELGAGVVTVTAAVTGNAAAVPVSADSNAASDTGNVCLKLFTKEPAGTVTGLSVLPQTVTVAPGGSCGFNVRAVGTGNFSQQVDWRLYGNQSQGTTMVGNTLYVAADEKASQLYVCAISRADASVTAVATVTVSNSTQSSGAGTTTGGAQGTGSFVTTTANGTQGAGSSVTGESTGNSQVTVLPGMVSLTDPIVEEQSSLSSASAASESVKGTSDTGEVSAGTVDKGIYAARSNGTAVFKKQTSSGKKRSAVVLPAKVQLGDKTYRVTALDARSFYKNTKLRTITLGNQLERIGSAAFYGCKNLTRIKIKSEQVDVIGSRAFAGISSKAVIYVPRSCLSDYRALVRSSGSKARVRAYN